MLSSDHLLNKYTSHLSEHACIHVCTRTYTCTCGAVPLLVKELQDPIYNVHVVSPCIKHSLVTYMCMCCCLVCVAYLHAYFVCLGLPFFLFVHVHQMCYMYIVLCAFPCIYMYIVHVHVCVFLSCTYIVFLRTKTEAKQK